MVSVAFTAFRILAGWFVGGLAIGGGGVTVEAGNGSMSGGKAGVGRRAYLDLDCRIYQYY